MSYEQNPLELVEQCKRGNRQAQFELYKRYSKAMYNVCWRMLGNQSDAEDVLQNSFIDIFTRLDSFRFESSIGAWMKRIVINNCINYLNKRKVRFDTLEDHHVEMEAEPQIETTDLNVPLVHAAIGELPEGYRVVLSLYLLEGYDHTEIAQILNISEATSKSQYSRARQRLKQLLQAKPLFRP